MAAMQMPIMMLLIFGVFYLLIIRPQAKKQKEHQQMLNKLGKGAVDHHPRRHHRHDHRRAGPGEIVVRDPGEGPRAGAARVHREHLVGQVG
jgi:hypothetical protein